MRAGVGKLNWIIAHWVQIIAALQTLWIAVRESFNRIANALPAPTKDSTDKYVFWFKFVNRMAGNTQRAEEHSIESSPNFIPAAEAYVAAKVASGEINKVTTN